MVVKVPGKKRWRIRLESGKTQPKRYASKAAAERRVGQMKYFKHRGKR